MNPIIVLPVSIVISLEIKWGMSFRLFFIINRQSQRIITTGVESVSWWECTYPKEGVAHTHTHT